MGEDKAWLDFGGQPLLLHVLARLAPLGAPRLVAAGAPGRRLPELPAGVALAWDRELDAGPLLGLEALFAALPEGRDLLLVASCDAPFIEAGLAAALAARLGEADAAVPSEGGRRHGLLGLYRARAGDAIAETLRSGRRSVHAWLSSLDCVELEAPALGAAGLGPDLLLNVNEPGELKRARARLEELG